jgi:hypothetical protein
MAVLLMKFIISIKRPLYKKNSPITNRVLASSPSCFVLVVIDLFSFRNQLLDLLIRKAITNLNIASCTLTLQ